MASEASPSRPLGRSGGSVVGRDELVSRIERRLRVEGCQGAVSYLHFTDAAVEQRFVSSK